MKICIKLLLEEQKGCIRNSRGTKDQVKYKLCNGLDRLSKGA